MTYVVQFTQLALASAKAKASVAAVEECARGELANLLADGLDNVDRLIFHVFGVGGCSFAIRRPLVCSKSIPAHGPKRS